ncbi:MAG: lipopolysaccharide core heptose(II) kinase RfaY [Bacteroidota bacterium]
MYISRSNGWRLLSHKSKSDIFEGIQNQSYQIVETLKEDYRSRVYRISLADHHYVLKIPNEKNTKPWIRFLTWFRSGEAFKNIRGMIKLKELEIDTTTPIIAAEKRSFGMVVDSWLVYEYLDGKSCLDKEEYYPSVVEKLKKMHAKGILHGDAQIRNFMWISGKIYVIDSNPKSTGLFTFSKTYEFAYLRKSAPGIDKYFGSINDSFWYKWSVQYDIYDRKLARWRKRVKKAIKGLFK